MNDIIIFNHGDMMFMLNVLNPICKDRRMKSRIELIEKLNKIADMTNHNNLVRVVPIIKNGHDLK